LCGFSKVLMQKCLHTSKKSQKFSIFLQLFDFLAFSVDKKEHHLFLAVCLTVSFFRDKIIMFLFSFSGFFNWTMSYRKDSDIFAPYGWVAREGKIVQTLKEICS
jgi:hypothetical protein